MAKHFALKLTAVIILVTSFTIIAFSFVYGLKATYEAAGSLISSRYTSALDTLVSWELERHADSYVLSVTDIDPRGKKPVIERIVSKSDPEGLKRLLYMSIKAQEQAESKLYRIEDALGEAGIVIKSEY